jgi:hypothetical protein
VKYKTLRSDESKRKMARKFENYVLCWYGKMKPIEGVKQIIERTWVTKEKEEKKLARQGTDSRLFTIQHPCISFTAGVTARRHVHVTGAARAGCFYRGNKQCCYRTVFTFGCDEYRHGSANVVS